MCGPFDAGFERSIPSVIPDFHKHRERTYAEGAVPHLSLSVAGAWRDGRSARILDGVPGSPYTRAAPIWTNRAISRSAIRFHCPSAAAAPLISPAYDGRNLYPLRRTCEVALLDHARVGFDGIVFDDETLYAFDGQTVIREDLAYLARDRRIAIGAGSVTAASPTELTAPPDVYFEWRHADDPSAADRLRPIYEAQRRTVQSAFEPRVRTHRALASLVCKRGYVYYYHVTHVLPLLCLMRDLLRARPEMAILTSGTCAEHFSLLGIAPERLIPYESDTLYEADLLMVPMPMPFLAPPRELLRLVRPAFLPHGAAGRPCIVVIRRRAGQATAFRRQVCQRLDLGNGVDVCVIENHDALLEAIRRRFPGEEVVDFDSDAMTLAEQIALFGRARAVVGAHGSGLANIVFATAGTRVLELMPQQSFFPLFWHLAASLDMPYAVHVVPEVTKYDNFAVDPDEIAGALATLLRL